MAIAFGIVFATALTLFMIPVLYQKFERKRWDAKGMVIDDDVQEVQAEEIIDELVMAAEKVNEVEEVPVQDVNSENGKEESEDDTEIASLPLAMTDKEEVPDVQMPDDEEEIPPPPEKN